MPLTDTLSEHELLRLAVAGDEEAFAALYERLKSNVYRFALHMSGSATLADDITQDAFITLIEEGGKFDQSKGQVLSFLTRHCPQLCPPRLSFSVPQRTAGHRERAGRGGRACAGE